MPLKSLSRLALSQNFRLNALNARCPHRHHNREEECTNVVFREEAHTYFSQLADMTTAIDEYNKCFMDSSGDKQVGDMIADVLAEEDYALTGLRHFTAIIKLMASDQEILGAVTNRIQPHRQQETLDRLGDIVTLRGNVSWATSAKAA